MWTSNCGNRRHSFQLPTLGHQLVQPRNLATDDEKLDFTNLVQLHDPSSQKLMHDIFATGDPNWGERSDLHELSQSDGSLARPSHFRVCDHTISTWSLHLCFHLSYTVYIQLCVLRLPRRCPGTTPCHCQVSNCWASFFRFLSPHRSLSVAVKGTLDMMFSVTYCLELRVRNIFCSSNVISHQVSLLPIL